MIVSLAYNSIQRLALLAPFFEKTIYLNRIHRYKRINGNLNIRGFFCQNLELG